MSRAGGAPCANVRTGMPHPCRGRDAARICKGGDLPSAWRRSRSTRTPLPRRCANGMPRPCGRGCRMVLQRRRSAVSMATISVSSHAAAARGQLFETKAGFLRALLPARKTGRARAKPRRRRALARGRAKISPVPLHLRKRRLFQKCASPRGCSRGSAFPAEAVFAAQRDGQRVAALRPPSLRKQRLLRSATDSGSRFFVRFLCGSGGHCATRASSAATSASLARMA